MKTLRGILTVLFLILFISCYSQDNEAITCCLPQLAWRFDQMFPLCTTDFNTHCGYTEVSSSICNAGCDVSPHPSICCNYYSTHGTPSLRDYGGKKFLELWGDSGDGGEGMSFCVDDRSPSCYNLTFEFKPGFGDNANVGFLKVFVEQGGQLSEQISSTSCYSSPPSVAAGHSLQIANLNLSNYDQSPYPWYTASINFSTTSALINTNPSISGFHLWFYSDILNSTERSIRIDNIVLTLLSQNVCDDDLVINENDLPIGGEYKAHNTISISGNPNILIEAADFIAGDNIVVQNTTLFEPPKPGQKSYLFIDDQCDECPYSIVVNSLLEIAEKPSDTDSMLTISNTYKNDINSLCLSKKGSSESIKILIVDPVLGIVYSDVCDKNIELREFVLSTISKLPKNRIYYVNLVCENTLMSYGTYNTFTN